MNSGIELWNRAKMIIPGGNQIFSKRSERFLPEFWPSYYSKAKGCEIWDLDGNHYYDFAGMGVGTCILGYADEDINNAVINTIKNGQMATLNVEEEVLLAEKLIDLHPWSEMARFARTGGEATAIAVRIARAFSGKDRIAFCGYHGWADWYLSSNLADLKSLDGQLLPGLIPNGVPRSLTNTAIPFNYNRIDELENIVNRYPDEVGVIIMEPRRGQGPKDGFLHKVREIANKIGAILIFDEITSGFRINLGGIHLTMDVNPDITVLGKAMGNGFPIAAILGKKPIMEAAQTSFISSTFWSERIGFTAALATISKMETTKAQSHMIEHGRKIQQERSNTIRKLNLNITLSGIDSTPYMSFDYPNSIAIQTYYIQEMLKLGYLSDMGIAISLAHTEEIINKFIENEVIILEKIKNLIDRKEVEMHLDGKLRHVGFKRLTE